MSIARQHCGAPDQLRGHPGRRGVKPSAYDGSVIDALCKALVTGMGMKAACRLPECPSHTAVYQRLAVDDGFRTRIARAREMQQIAQIDEIVAMADAATPENWQVVRLQIWVRQWAAAKLAPKIFGDKRQAELNSNTGFGERLDAALARRQPSHLRARTPSVVTIGPVEHLAAERVPHEGGQAVGWTWPSQKQTHVPAVKRSRRTPAPTPGGKQGGPAPT